MSDAAAGPAIRTERGTAAAPAPARLAAGLRAVPELVWVAALAMGLTALWLWRTDLVTYEHALFPLPWDRHKYIAMAAGNPFDFHIAPFCWRIGKPLLAKLLPFGLQNSFLVISFVSVWLAGVFSWLLARAFGFSRALALTGLLFFFALQWGPKFFLFEFWLPDSTICMLVILAVLLLRRGQLAAFVVVTTLGVTVKESMLFVLPLAYTFTATRWIDWPAARRSALIGLPAVLTFVAIRLAIPAWNDDPAYVATLPERLWLVSNGSPEYDLAHAVRVALGERAANFGYAHVKSYTVATFGPALTLLALLALHYNRAWLVRLLPFMALVAAQMLFGHDIERYLILAFPAVLVLALSSAAGLSARFGIPELAWALVPGVLVTFELVRVWPYFLPLREHLLALLLALAAIAVITAVQTRRARGSLDVAVRGKV